MGNHTLKSKFFLALLGSICIFQTGFGQSLDGRIARIDRDMSSHKKSLDSLRTLNDSLKMLDIMERLEAVGWPGNDDVIKHSAMALAYDENHEMAKWVAHIIRTDVVEGNTSRTNDFREDPFISTRSAQESDYFVKTMNSDSTYTYDGFGFDRGHLAPSADFRWNQKALSESYYYSNMTPQRPEFNRDSWAQVELNLRDYVARNEFDLYVVTGPVLHSDLPRIDRSTNQISIPEKHFKVAADLQRKKGVAFLMSNEKASLSVENYMITIDELEALTGFNFFPNLSEADEKGIESKFDHQDWMPESQQGDVPVLTAESLSKNQYNTQKAYAFADSNKHVYICGTVVSVHKSDKNNVFLNFDKKFPNNIFSVSIWSRNLNNFSYAPEIELKDKKICVKGQVTLREGIPQMTCESEKHIVFLNEDATNGAP